MKVVWGERAKWTRRGRHALGRLRGERGGPLKSPAGKKIIRRGTLPMSDVHTTQPPTADPHEAEGHGRHRGQISAHEAEKTSPRGRHRKPAEHTETTTSA